MTKEIGLLNFKTVKDASRPAVGKGGRGGGQAESKELSTDPPELRLHGSDECEGKEGGGGRGGLGQGEV